MWRVIAPIALLLSLVMATSVAAETIDDSPEVVSLYNKGKRLLRQAEWLDAARLFEELSGRFPDSRNFGLFLFNRAKAEYYFGDYDKALAGFNLYISRYTDSRYHGHARFFVGNIYYIKGKPGQALASYIEAYGLTSDTRLEQMLQEAIGGVITAASTVDIGPVDFDMLDEEKRCRLIRAVADLLLERSEFYAARNLLETCGVVLDVGSEPAFQESAAHKELELAMVLPFSGELQTYGDEVYNGAVIGADFYRQEANRQIKLVPYDTQGDPVNAARIVRGIVNSSADAVIGPLTSDEALIASAVLNRSELPMIAPAATQAGLTELSRSSFQLSPNIELQAVKMAEYAVRNLHADSAAIVTSTDIDHLRMSRTFAERFRQLGGEIIAIEYYRPRDNDFGPYVRDIKAILLGLVMDSTFYIDDRGDTLDADGIPVSIDCLYLPGDPNQLRLLLPQIRFYNLNAAYLGSDGWGDDTIYRLGDEVTKLAVFTSPFLQWTRGEEYAKFSAAYDARYGKPPQRLAALGYDAVRTISQAYLAGGDTREKLVEKLEGVRQYQGAAAAVTFGEHHENIEMPIYRIESGTPVPIGEGQPVADTENQ